MIFGRLRTLACAILLLAAASPPPWQHFAATPGQAVRGGDFANDSVVRTNIVGRYAVVVVSDSEGNRSSALAERFSLGWQVVDNISSCTLAARGIGASDRAILLAGVPASAQIGVPREGCASIDLADRGSPADVASLRNQLYSFMPLLWYDVAIDGDFAAAYQAKANPTYFQRAGGGWKKLIGGNSDESATEAELHAVGLSDETLCALGRCRYFHSPTGNTGCLDRELRYDGSGGHFRTVVHVLRCDVIDGLVPLPPRTRSCTGTWGRGYELGATGEPAVLCADDSVLARGGILDYGTTWSTLSDAAGGTTKTISCTSRTSGLTCTNGAGHGFFIARGESRTF